MIVDDVAVLAAALRRPAPPQGQELRRPEEALEAVVVEVNIETVADQTRRDSGGELPQRTKEFPNGAWWSGGSRRRGSRPYRLHPGNRDAQRSPELSGLT